MKNLRYVSTFSGIGGLDFGLEKMGAECVGFSEIRDSSIRIYEHHYPDHKWLGDITKLPPEEWPDHDVFTGGFPCQSFSLAGARQGFGDRRGQMIFHIYDILMAKQPEFVVLENVKGISTHNGGKTIRDVIKLLSAAGYFVRVVLLNSAHYGSAQARERVVFLCRRGQDFPAKNPEKRDDTKRFRDIREHDVDFKYLSEKALARFERDGLDGFIPIGGYDRVNTLTTGVSSSGRDSLIVQEEDGRWRYMTAIEGERLQGFPDGWTDVQSEGNRWFALGNAVNCGVSDYLFNDYLKGLWW